MRYGEISEPSTLSKPSLLGWLFPGDMKNLAIELVTGRNAFLDTIQDAWSQKRKQKTNSIWGNRKFMRKTCLVMSSWTRSVLNFVGFVTPLKRTETPGCWVRAALDEHGCKAKSCDNKSPHLWHEAWNAGCYRSLVSRTMIYIRLG